MASSTTDRRLGLTSDKGIKAPVAAATLTNITLSGEQTIDGVAVLASNAAGVPDRVLVKNQTSSIDNGVWDVSTGAWTRSVDSNGTQDLVTGTIFYVVGGTQAGQFWGVSSTGQINPGSTALTFSQSVNTSILGSLAATNGASLVGWIRGLTGAVAYTVGTFLGWQKPNALEFMTTAQRIDVLANTALVDVTAAFQAAVTASAGRVLECPGTMLITNSISYPVGCQLLGEHRNKSIPASANGSKILFQPTTAKSLFVPDVSASFRTGVSIENFFIVGNSASSTDNSIYALDAYGLNQASIKNLTISGFRTGIHCYASIDNRFENVKIANTYIQSVLYDGGFATTDVWEQCYFGNSPIGIQTNGANLGIRFNSPLFESITTYGVNIVKESYGFEFNTTYVEDTPSDNIATNAMFRVGFDGTTLAGGAGQLRINGGLIGGRNAGAVGSLLTVDFTDGVIIGGGLNATRYTNVIKTSANTQTKQIIATGWTQSSIASTVSDATKVCGIYPTTSFNGATRNQQEVHYGAISSDSTISAATTVGVGAVTPSASGAGVSFPSTQSASTDLNTLDDYDEYTAASTACTGAITTAVIWKLTKVGNQVTLTLPPTTGTATAVSSITYGVTMPAKYRPAATMWFPCSIQDNGAALSTPGMVSVRSDGVIKIFKDMTAATNFTAAASAGLGQGGGISMSWTI